MAYKLEHVYDDDGTVLSHPLHTTSLAGATNLEYDGRYLWVSCSAGVAIYEWWGLASDHEPNWDTLDELTYPRYDKGDKKKLRLVTFITVSATSVKRSTILESLQDPGAMVSGSAFFKVTARTGTALSPYWIRKCAGKMYVTNGANFKQIFEFDINSQTLLREITTEEKFEGVSTTNFIKGTVYGMNSNLGVSNAKLWFVGSPFSDNAAQKLYSYDPITNAKTTTDIPVRPSMARTWISTGYNGSVYIANYNNVSISRFSDVDGSYGATIRLNAFPTHIFTGTDRRIWVSSFAGMLSLVDYDDDQVHNDYSVGIGENIRAVALQSDPNDGSKVWFVNTGNQLAQHDLNTHQQIELGNDGKDWQFSHVKLKSPEQLWISTPFYYQDENLQTHLVKPYMFLIEGGKLLAFRMEKYLYRDVYASLRGQAAVVESPRMYFGEQ